MNELKWGQLKRTPSAGQLVVLKTEVGQRERPKCRAALGPGANSPKTTGEEAESTKFTTTKRLSLTKEPTTLKTRTVPKSTLSPQCLNEKPSTEQTSNKYLWNQGIPWQSTTFTAGLGSIVVRELRAQKSSSTAKNIYIYF